MNTSPVPDLMIRCEEIVRDYRLNPTEVVVLLVILRHVGWDPSDGTRYLAAWPSRQTLADATGKAPKNVWRALRSLAEKGILTKEHRFDFEESGYFEEEDSAE